MNDFTLDDNSSSEILSTLKNFDQDHDKTKPILEKKYEYGAALSQYPKLALEMTKIELERLIDTEKTTFYALFGTIFLVSVLLPILNIESIWQSIGFGFSLFLMLVTLFKVRELRKKSNWLHIVKIAIIRKSELSPWSFTAE